MKAILKVDINDWTTKNVPNLKKGTVIFVTRLEDTKRKLIPSDYIASVTVNKQTLKFMVKKSDFDCIN